jgi:hypothetical protein
MSTYYTLERLTGVRNYLELNKVCKDKAGGMAHHRRISSQNDSIISIDGPPSKKVSPQRLRSIDRDFEDSIFRPSLIGMNNN